MSDTLSFARSFKAATNDEERAELIARFVLDAVKTSGDGAATRSDAVRITNEIGGLERRVDQLLEQLGAKAETQAQTVAERVDGALARVDEKLGADLRRLDQKMNALSDHLEARIKEGTDKAKTPMGGLFIFHLLFGALTVVGTWLALNAPGVKAFFERTLAPLMGSGG